MLENYCSLLIHVGYVYISVAQKAKSWKCMAALVTHKKISLRANFWTDWTIFRGRAHLTLFSL